MDVRSGSIFVHNEPTVAGRAWFGVKGGSRAWYIGYLLTVWPLLEADWGSDNGRADVEFLLNVHGEYVVVFSLSFSS